MASTTTQLQIVNRALQLLGSPAISLITENSRGAKAMNRAYQPVLLKTLRENYWNFSIKRAVLATAAVPPIFGPNNYFPLPGDFIDLAIPDQVSDIAFPMAVPPFSSSSSSNSNANTSFYDWKIEAMPNGEQAIISNATPPLYIRYVSSNVTESMFDTIFAEALAANLAFETCEELTQSNTKLQNIGKMYDDAIELAKQRNAFETRPVKPPVDSFITARF